MNDVILQKLKTYNASTPESAKDALKEIIQEIALLGLWRSKFFEQAVFYGGTALRILYGLDRFSEDLDFTLKVPQSDFSLAPYCKAVTEELSAYGFEATTEQKIKKQQTSVASAFIKADTLVHLIKVGSHFRSTKGKSLQVKFEVDTEPASGFSTEAKPFFWPIAFSVETCDLPSLFSGKLHAMLCRERIANVKGRDFYDFLWYISRRVKPNYLYLERKLRQTGHWQPAQIFDPMSFKVWAKHKLEFIDVGLAKKDVQRFLLKPENIAGWSKDIFLAAIEQL